MRDFDKGDQEKSCRHALHHDNHVASVSPARSQTHLVDNSHSLALLFFWIYKSNPIIADMSRAIHCLGRRAMVLLRPYPALMPTTSNSILDRHMIHVSTSRNLFSATAIGIDKLDRLRSGKSQVFTGDARKRYFERIKGYFESGDTKSVYRDDLVNLIAIAESDEELDLIEHILENSSEEQRTFFSGWGTTLMRLYYKLNQMERAVNNLKNAPRFGDFFNMRSCYKIAMTMLYDNEQYSAVLDLYHLSEERLKDTAAYTEYKERTGNELTPDRDLVMLAFAALARVNNQEALQEAKTLFRKTFTANARDIGLRPSSLLAYLAIQNGDAMYALNLISTVSARNYVSLRDTKIMALIQLERYDDVLLQLRDYASGTKFNQNRLLKSTFEALVECKSKIQDVACRQELDDLLAEIKEFDYVSDETLDTLIFRPIEHERQATRPRNESGEIDTNRRGFREDGRGGQSFRRNRYNSQQDSGQFSEDGRDSYRPRRDENGRRAGGPRNERNNFSFQNVNFET